MHQNLSLTTQQVLIHHNLQKRDDLANLESEADKLDIDKLSKLDADKFRSVPTDLNKLNDLVKSDVVKKKDYNAKIKSIEDKISSITNLATNAALDAKINEVKGEIPNITNLTTTATLTTVENKISNVSDDLVNLPSLPQIMMQK